MKMMKGLAVLVLSCIMSMQAYCGEAELKERRGHKRPAYSSIDAQQVYMYPNTKPKVEHIFTLDLSDKGWDETQDERKFNDVRKNILKIFSKENFVILPGSHICPGSLGNKVITTLGKFIGGELDTCVIIDMEYRPRSIRFNLENDVNIFEVNKAFRPLNKKWDVKPMKGEPKITWINYHSCVRNERCNELSWKWVDCSIHSMVSNVDDYSDAKDPHKAQFLKSLYGKIKRYGLENTVIRIAVSANDAGFYSFNAIYETEKQKEVVRNFLKRLMKKIHSSHIS